MKLPPDILTNEIRQLLDNPVLFILVIVAGSALGSYFAGYLKQRGMQKAQKEDFEAIRTQLAATTRDTEEIKQKLNKTTWLTQQQWVAREKYYVELLGALHRFKTSLEALYDFYLEPGAENTPDREFGEPFKVKKAEAATAFSKAQDLLGAAALYLSSEATRELDKMFEKHWELITFESNCTYEYIDNASKMAQDAYRFTLAQARRQLLLPEDA